MIRRQHTWLVIGLALLITLVTPAGVWAAPGRQESGDLWLNGMVTGTLDAVTPERTHTFFLNEGMTFSLTAWSRSGDLVSRMVASGPGGQVIGEGVVLGPDRTFTVLEAVVAPVSGLYSVTIARTGSTAGDYTVFLMPGYSVMEYWDTFDLEDDPFMLTWTPYRSERVDSNPEDGRLRITVLTENMVGYHAPDDDITWSDLYLEADIEIAGSPSYYEYGFAVRMAENGSQFYLVTFSSDGDWSVYYSDSSDWIPIQQYTVSPVIDGTDKTPRIGLFVQDTLFRVYFNGQFVGEVRDVNNSASEGSIAMVMATIQGQTDTLTGYFDNLMITSPSTLDPAPPQAAGSGLTGVLGTPATAAIVPTSTTGSGVSFGLSGGKTTPSPTVQPTTAFVMPTLPPIATVVPPTQPVIVVPTLPSLPIVPPTQPASQALTSWTSSRPSDVVGELQRQGVVPLRGSLTLTIPSSFGDTSSSGLNYYPLGQGRTFRNFVLGFDARLELTGPESGCGMHVRRSDASSTIALVTEDGWVFLGQLSGEQYHDATVFESSPTVLSGQGATNRVFVTAVEGDMRMYVNGQLAAQAALPVQAGTLALQVYVASDGQGRTQRTYCQLENIWLWEF